MRAAVLAFALSGCTGGASPSDAGANEGGPAPPANGAAPAPSGTAAPSAASASATAASTAAPGDAAPGGTPWARKLAPILFRDVNTLADVPLRLYRDDGTLDEAAVAEAERVLWAPKEGGKLGKDGRPSKEAKVSKDGKPSKDDEDGEVPPVSRRLLQLVVKAAAHFDAHEVQVISSHRGGARKGSRHRTGEAIDFVFPGVPPKALAEVLRTYPKVGVGVYVHPRSQFVHLDVREQSYHWIDGSPPGRSWREIPLPDPTAAARDAAYTPAQDLPDSAAN